MYGVSYDDVPTDEAIDLALSLPQGSAYRGALSADGAWSHERHRMADMVDLLMIVNWRLMGCPEQYKPAPVVRPGDAERRAAARMQAKRASERIESTSWKEA